MERPSFTGTPTDTVLEKDEKNTYAISTGVAHSGGQFPSSKDSVGEIRVEELAGYDVEGATSEDKVGALETVEDLVTTVIHLDDDPSLSPWTFRMFFLGMGLSAFGAVLQEIFYFKPQVIFVSVMFLTVIAQVAGEAMALLIPRWGPVGRFLNPGPWNVKEHTAVVLMSSAASVAALSTEALAVQKLFYGGYPNAVAGVFITLSTQLIGFGVGGLLRPSLLWPTKMLWPSNLPITTVMETLHKDKSRPSKRLRVFWIVFGVLFVWEWFPEYIFTILGGVSIFCLAHQDSLVFTNLFGGAQGNEGMGLLSICFDWNYIAGFGSPLWYPLQTLFNSMIGYFLGIALSIGLYYSNTWRSFDFPFMSQLLFDKTSNSTNYVTYNQTAVFNADFTINDAAVEAQGIPYLTGTYVAYMITTNAATTATLIHMFLWNYNEIKLGWAWLTVGNLKKAMKPSTYALWRDTGRRTEEDKQRILKDLTVDPHYKVMINYDEVPNSWYWAVFFISWITGCTCLYVMKSTLPWWGLVIATIFTAIFTLFFGAQLAMTGFNVNLQPVFQMIAGYLLPGKPLANMYFNTYTFNAISQSTLLLRDLKLAQQNKLSPKCAFVTQILGCMFGALLNYVMMITIVKNQAPILESIEGTNIWSGANIQQLNTLAIAWSIAPKMFSIGARYQWVTLAFFIGFVVPLPFYAMNRFFPRQRIWSYFNLAIILWYLGYLFVGLNASITMYYIIGIFGQYYLRKYRPKYFVKWNYLISAAMDGGTQVFLFLATFALNGGSGTAHPFPEWAGNHPNNIDYCMFNPANG